MPSTGGSRLRLPHPLPPRVRTLVDRAVGAVGDPLLVGQTLVEGTEHLPQAGPAVVVSNHARVLDHRLLNAVSPRPLTLVEVPRQFQAGQPWQEQGRRHAAAPPGKRGAARGTGQPSGVPESLRTALDLLARGNLVLVFAEGSRSPDGLLHKGRTGLGALVLAAGVAVVPVAVTGGGRATAVRFGAPLDFSRFHGLPLDRTLARGVTDEVVARIAELGGLEYADSYTSTARDLLKVQGRARANARRLRAAAQREADRAAVLRHRLEVAEEQADLARRREAAAEQARRHAAEAAARDGRRDAHQ